MSGYPSHVISWRHRPEALVVLPPPPVLLPPPPPVPPPVLVPPLQSERCLVRRTANGDDGPCIVS